MRTRTLRLAAFAAALFAPCFAAAQFPFQVQTPRPQSFEPHPAVVRVVVPERDGTAYGSGTLIDRREDYGLVLTNWHVVRDATGPIEVQFPSGFTSQARALKMDSEWDLAALVIWRPPSEPVKMATQPPRPGDWLTIAGYGKGDYRAITGRCTQFYSPKLELPRELVELDVEARQGDSGGPIFNNRGELAGVLFGAGEGTTLGSFEGRVKTFLASLAPDIGLPSARDQTSAPQVALRPQQTAPVACNGCQSSCQGGRCPLPTTGLATTGSPLSDAHDLGNVCFGCENVAEHQTKPKRQMPTGRAAPEDEWPAIRKPAADAVVGWEAAKPNFVDPSEANWPTFGSDAAAASGADVPSQAGPLVPTGAFEQLKNLLAIVGAVAIVFQVVRLAG